MSIARKLAFLLALALAAMAVSAPAAFATDSGAFGTAGAFPNTTGGTDTFVTPAPATRTLGQGQDYIGTETAPGTIVTNNGTVISCPSWDFWATVIEDGTATDAVRIDGFSFGAACTELNQGLECTVMPTTLPMTIRGDFETADLSNWQSTSGNEAFTITCAMGTVICKASVDNTLTGTVDGRPSAGNTLVVDGDNNMTIDAGSILCGTIATWTQSWDITTPAAYTITT
jgi:hypothetical protein